MFVKDELEKMSKEQLILHINELYLELEKIKENKKSRAGVVTVGSPKYVSDFITLKKKTLEEGGSN